MQQNFEDKVLQQCMVLPQATEHLVSNGDNIVVFNFTCFGANDVYAGKLPLETEQVARLATTQF